MSLVKTVTSFAKRKLYLINRDPIKTSGKLELERMGVGFSKFVVLQTINEFKDAAYNDVIAGELYNSEAAVKAKLRSDEYYLVLSVPANAVSEDLPDGRVLVHRGFKPKILSLRTIKETYHYDEECGFFREATAMVMSPSNHRIYNYKPQKWPLFASLRQRAYKYQ